MKLDKGVQMDAFSFYFSGSPIKSSICFLIYLLISIIVLKNKFTFKRFSIVVLVFAMFIYSNFDIGVKKADLHVDRFNNHMSSDTINPQSIESREKYNTKEKFNYELKKLKKGE